MKDSKRLQNVENALSQELIEKESTVSKVLIGNEERARGQYPSAQMSKKFYAK
jgi:hypothetical protein